MIGQLIASFELDTSNFEKSYAKVDRKFVAMQKSVFNLKNAFLGLGAGMAVRNLVNTAVELDRVNNTLKFATGSAEGAAQAMSFLRVESDRMGQDVLRSAETFAQLSAAAKGTAVSAEDVKEIFLGVSEASTVLGLSAEQAQGALRAIEQMISKGNVQAEELRGQLGERLPGAFNIAARAMGVTTQELNKMLEQGKVTAADMLPKLAKELRKTFGPDVADAAQSTQAKLNRLNNELVDLKATLIDSGIVDGVMAFGKGLAWLAEKSVEAAKGTGIIAAQLSQFVGQGEGFHERMFRLFIAPFEHLKNIINGTVGEIADLPVAQIDGQIAAIESRITNLQQQMGSKARFGLVSQETLDEIAFLQGEIDKLLLQRKEMLKTPDGGGKAGGSAAPVVDNSPVFVADEKSLQELEKLSIKLRDQVATFGMADSAALKYRLTQGDLAEALGKAGEEGDAFAASILNSAQQLEEMEAAAKAVEEVEALTKSVMTAQERYNAEIAEYTELMKTAGLSQETFNRLQQEAKKRMDEATQGFDFMKAAGEEAGRAVQASFANFFRDMDGSISNMAKNFIDAIRDILSNALALQAIKWMFGGTDMGASLFPSMFAPGKALGGPVSANKPYTVGENGPELFVPNQSGNIVPNGKLNATSGQVTIIQHINAQGAVSAAEVVRMVHMGKDAAVNEAVQIMSRGMAR